MQSVVKKVRPIKPGDLNSPYPIDMPAAAWRLGIANPQSIKWLGQFLTADNISAGTPNGGRAYPVLRIRPIKLGDLQSPYPIDMPATAWLLGIANPQSIKRLGHFLTADNISAGTPDGGHGISGAAEVRAYPAQRRSGHIQRYGLKHFLASHEIFAAP